MTNYDVTAIDSLGARRNFRRAAAGAGELRDALRAEGLVVVAIEEGRGATERGTDATSAKRQARSALPWRMSPLDVEMGLRQLSSMLRSAVPLLACLETVAEQSLRSAARRTWGAVASCVEEGRTFAEALAQQGGVFGEVVVRLAEVGERSGELANALARAADELEARRGLRTTVVNALAYPVLAVVMAAAVSAYLTIGVIPKLADFLRAGGVALPAVTQMLMDFSDWVVAHGLAALGAFALGVAAILALRLWSPAREAEDALVLRLPVAGRILRLSGTALFARSMQIMTESGVTLIDALTTAARLLANRRLRRRAAAAAERVLRGQSLDAALADATEFMPMLRRMAAVGVVTGSLPDAFGETARFHEMLLAIAVRRLGMAIEPVMIVVTGGIVGFVYIAFFVTLFAIAGIN